MYQRLRQVLLVGSASWFSWLAMMLVHELGHIIGAFCTGGTVRHLVWFPTDLSRTDVSPNPHPLVEVWAGPVFGSLFPLLVAMLAIWFRLRITYLFMFFAGFCLLANGTYIGIGYVWPVGDAKVLVGHGTPRAALAIFGALTVIAGFLIWERVSPRFGFGRFPTPINTNHTLGALVAAIFITALCWACGQSA